VNTDKARKLRKRIYGDMSQRVEREYVAVHGGKKSAGSTIMNAPESLRSIYQKAKRRT
jgi:hypothetical protein